MRKILALLLLLYGFIVNSYTATEEEVNLNIDFKMLLVIVEWLADEKESSEPSLKIIEPPYPFYYVPQMLLDWILQPDIVKYYQKRAEEICFRKNRHLIYLNDLELEKLDTVLGYLEIDCDKVLSE